MKALDKLAAMRGKEWMYKTNTVKILSYKLVEEKVYIVTDKDWVISPLSQLPQVIEEFLEVEQEEQILDPGKAGEVERQKVIHDNVALQVVAETRSGMEQLRKELMESITKIKEDKNFIPQAKAINNNVNTIINMVKLEFTVTKELKRK